MPVIKYKYGSVETSIPLFEELDAEKKLRAEIDGTTYYAALTSKLDDKNASKLRVKDNNGWQYAFLTQKPAVCKVTSDAYKMKDVYPDTYTTMTSVPPIFCYDIDYLGSMFDGCASLQEIPSIDNTRANTSFYRFFYNCKELKAAPEISTIKGKNFDFMYYGCSSLTSAPAINTTKCTNFSFLYQACKSLTEIPALNTCRGVYFTGMFKGCSDLKTVPKMSTWNGTDFKSMFEGCSSLPTVFPWTIDCKSIKNPEKMKDMFSWTPVTKVTFKNASKYIKDNLTADIIKSNGSLGSDKGITIVYDDSETLTATQNKYRLRQFYPDSYETIKSIPQIYCDGLTNLKEMFSLCRSLEEIPELNTSANTDFSNFFSSCSSLKEIPEFDTSNATNFNNIFWYCESLTEIPELDTSNVTNFGQAFYCCCGLKKIPQLDTSNVTDFSSAFNGCDSLTEVPPLDTSKATSMYQAFQGCKSLPEVFPWPIDCSSITEASGLSKMFMNSSVRKVTFKNLEKSLRSSITERHLLGPRAGKVEGYNIKIEFVD